jgi:hypothetical protein
VKKVQRLLAASVLVVGLAAAGCSGSSSSACAPVENGVGVCFDGTPVTWSPNVMKPHMHETGGYYGPALDLAGALGVASEIAADKKSVTVGGESVVAKTQNAKGIHQHDAAVYVPIKEFAEAAGFHVMVDGEKHTVDIRK